MTDLHDQWRPTWPPPLLEAQAIHVWQIPLTGSDAEITQARELLAPAELSRADRFVFPKHQQRFALGRAAVRRILGGYLQLPPTEIAFEYEALGKPRLRGSAPHEGLCFNFSNSHQLGLLAVTRDIEIGVDIEWHRDLLDMMGLAERFFCATEIAKLKSLAGEEQRAAFFRLWTRKEAFLKAVGKGLTFPLNRVEVSCLAEEIPEILTIDGEVAQQWALNHLRPAAEYTGAVALSGKIVRICCYSSIG